MTEKLELKYLSGYLPYELKILWRSVVYTMDVLHLSKKNREYKPILHSLSDLTKPCLEGGKIPIVELLKIQESAWYNEVKGTGYAGIEVESDGYPKAYFNLMASKEIMIRTFEMTNLQYWIIEKLFEWHFDIYGLIESGLAVNINTIK